MDYDDVIVVLEFYFDCFEPVNVGHWILEQEETLNKEVIVIGKHI